jgi:hypothetical protein
MSTEWNNPYMTAEEITQAFLQKISVHLEENHNFVQEDLEKIATGFILIAAPKIAKMERDQCIEFVRSLNTRVADALEEKRGK